MPVLPWKTMVSANQLFAELQGLSLESYATYTVLLRVNNYAGQTSSIVVSNVTIETEAPRVTGTSKARRTLLNFCGVIIRLKTDQPCSAR